MPTTIPDAGASAPTPAPTLIPSNRIRAQLFTKDGGRTYGCFITATGLDGTPRTIARRIGLDAAQADAMRQTYTGGVR